MLHIGVTRASAARLYIQADNTVREVKNALSGMMMAALVSSRFFNECGHHHLPKGHTHEDIGK